MLKKIKDWLYYYFAEKNWGVRREYGPYVDAHQEEHRKHRWKHWWLLVRLNWHYRVLRKKTWMLIQGKRSLPPMPYLKGAESEYRMPIPPQHFVKTLLKYDVVSFDVFDTLIFRPFSTPSIVFTILQEKTGVRHFSVIRKKMEQEVRVQNNEKFGTREVTLEEIYAYIHNETGLDTLPIMKEEIELECDLCYANPFMLAVFNILRAYGKRIIITTDMYLSREVINNILNKNGFAGYEELYVSGEIKRNKATGKMYEYIKDKMGNELTYIHVGDNLHSDVKMAKENGWESRYYANVNEVGKPFRATQMSPIISATYAGIVNAYLHNGMFSFSPQYEFGFIYGGIYVFGYVNWIHQYAVTNNIDKVVFLSRDGCVLKQVYDYLFDDIPSEYLYWSRAATIRYDLERNKIDFLNRTINYRIINKADITIGQILKSIEADFLIEKLTDYGLEESEYLCESNKQKITRLIIDHFQRILENYNLEEEEIKKYVCSVINGKKKICVVDVGWAGTGPQTIKYLVETKWGLDCSVDMLLAACLVDSIQVNHIHTYLFSLLHNKDHLTFHFHPKRKAFSNDLFEILTQSAEPSFIGIHNSRFVFSSPMVESYKYVKEIHNGIVDFCVEYSLRTKKMYGLIDISGYDAYCPFKMLISYPQFFKDFLGSFPIETNTGGTIGRPELLIDFLRKKGV